MNDDLVGIGGLLGCIVLLVLYALAIGAKTKERSINSDYSGQNHLFSKRYFILSLRLSLGLVGTYN